MVQYLFEEKVMSTIKVIWCFITLIVLVTIVSPVSANPFSGIIQAGSSFDMTVGSVTTNSNEGFIGTDAGMPTFLNYEIHIKPYNTALGQIPAMGSASAYYKFHTMEGRTGSNTVSQEMTSSETTYVNGIITGFSKVIKWQSGVGILS
jgi:hypothetical protein